ncbi:MULTISPECIES: BON domain-containing protein [Comamonas]|uniref:Transporter n=1 Tax=Comamonas aquatica DA1877 TaxID=1457173 RepID=A0A014NKJ7_9BURK|nr:MULTISPECIES: BON domain-containing protein [Comamonas]EXU79993.1 transporter [Comamonas aquatica DA1877]MDH1674661.1 BON domain-containing protein [Comamonas aquatica]MDH1678305.1 BON domain-containing protein [Comamonas aquatica]MDH1767526.1 BON domain-containing protein [Comamonas aquatica]MDH1815750.1 BON domain-containing protein [Comamonas aquatica]
MKRGWCRTGLTLVAAGVLAGSLTACVPLLLGGGAVTTALVASDRRTSGMYLEDERIEQSAAAKLRETLKEGTRASVTSFNRLALVTGEVRSEAEKAEVGRTVASVENVRNVVNEVEVVPFISSIGQRSRDTLLTSQVKASLIDAKDLQANTIKVVTEMNVVYLMGIVTPREAQRAAEIARGVNNVRKVVRVFENISEQELASYNTRQQPAPVVQDPAAK